MAGRLCATLNTGAKMPMFGLGTWQSKPGEVKAAVEAAIDAGYRHIDCALVYGNENEVGDAIQAKIKEGIVKREDLFITTKLWLTFYTRVRECIEKSLKSLKLDYVDLYLMHWPFALKYDGDNTFPRDAEGKLIFDESTDYVDVWKEMEKLPETGLTRAVGISNFNKYQLERLLRSAKIVPAVNQYECHPYFGRDELLSFCQSKKIVVTAYSPFASPDRPVSSPDDPVLLDDVFLKSFAEKRGKTVAQVILRYLMQRGMIVIPKSVTPSRIRSNFEVFDFSLSDEDMAAIKKIDRNFQALKFALVADHKYYPFQDDYKED